MAEIINNTAQQPAAPKYELATMFERAVAFLLDFFLFVALAFWSFYILAVFGGWMPEPWQVKAWLSCFWFLFVLYAAIFNSGGRRTLGKFFMGIQAVDRRTLAPIGFVKAFIRALGYIVGVFTLFAGFALALLNKNRRAVEDLMAGTIVVSTREKGAGEAAVIAAFGTVLMGLCVFFAYYILFLAPSVFDNMRVEAAREQLARIAFVQFQHKKAFGDYTADMVRLGLISGDPVGFQREVQRNLKRRGFGMGVARNGFSIRAVAKDSEGTEVVYNFTE